MKTRCICLALTIVLLCPLASGQWVQTNDSNDRQVPHHPLVGMTVAQETPRELLRLPSQLRMQADSLRARGMQSPLPDGKSIGIQRSFSSLRKVSSLQSQIYVIDTAIVRSTFDTTRHLYSFKGKAKRVTDVTQNLKAGLWVDTLRHTNAYDASNNMLSDLLEQWSNGQWVDVDRKTYTYDASNNMHSELYEHWLDSQWVNRTLNTYTYDANRHLLSNLIEAWDGGWLNYGCYTYTYDASGNMLSDSYVFWSFDQFLVYYPWRDTLTYDENGHILTELHEVGWVGPFVNDNRWTYTYDSTWAIVSKLNEKWLNGQWVPGQRYTYTYDAEGSMLFWLTELWSNDQWVNSERSTYAYDAEGNLTSLWHYGWLNSSWTSTDIGEGGGFGVSDSAGNTYDLGYGYNCTLIRKLIVTGVASQSGNLPAVCSLSQNYPNPFNPTTKIQFTIVSAKSGSASGGNRQLTIVNVYDVLGREVATLVNEVKEPGTYTVQFSGSGLACGVYFYRLQAGSFVQTKKLLLLR
jgi:Secretion system C-terminal sorting domain